VEELRISDAVMSNAQKHKENYQQKICIAFREALRKQNNGRAPAWVEYGDLVFTKLRDVPAAQKGTP
jgi:hypothetical protein